jgi:hypothetical protein
LLPTGSRRLQPLLLLALILTMPLSSIPLAAQSGGPSHSSAPSSAHGISVVGDKIVIQTETISIVLSIPEKGAILNMTNDLTGQYLKLNQSLTNYLWGVDSFDQIMTSSQADQFNYTIDQSTNSTDLALAWRVPDYYLVHALVEARADGFIGMKLSVTNLNPGVEIGRAIFPYIGGIQSMGASAGDDLLSIPEREGFVIQNVTTSVLADPVALQYPGSLSMQYVYFYEQNKGGIYLGMQDSQSNYKGLELLKAASNAYSFDWFQYGANITMGRGYEMDYFAMFKGVVGADWSSGAQVYKDWALKQWYASAGPLAQRTDIPTWVKGLDLVWGTQEYATNQTTDQVYLLGTPSSQMGAFMGQVRQMLPNASMMLYWTGWNHGGFDRGYPDYYPPRDGVQPFVQAINATHALGIKVMLYFNGRLVDVKSPVYNQSLPYLSINSNGAPSSVSYDNGTLTGVVPAPTTSWWVNTVVNFTVTAVRDYGVDGVFLDQNTVASPQLDMSTTHGHLPGGGSWWWQAESNLLASVRASIRHYNPQAILSSENVNEVYIKDVDLFQSYDYQFDFENLYPIGFSAPLFAYVYHGYALQDTSYLLPFGAPGYATGSYLHGIAQSIANGYVPGVSTGLAPSDIWWFTGQSKSVLQTIVQTRQAVKQFLTYGVTPPLPVFQTKSNFYLGAPVFVRNLTAPAITRGEYQLPDGRKMIVLANMAGRGRTESGSFPNGLSPESAGPLLATEAMNGKTSELLVSNGSAPLSVTIPPLSVETITLEPGSTSTVLVSGSQARASGPLYPLLFSSSSKVTRVALDSREEASGTSVLSLSVSVNESAASGYLHLVFPADLMNFTSAEGGVTLDGGAANSTTYQNATTNSVSVEYGEGTHTVTILSATILSSGGHGSPLLTNLYTAVALVVLASGAALVGWFVLFRRRRPTPSELRVFEKEYSNQFA